MTKSGDNNDELTRVKEKQTAEINSSNYRAVGSK